MDVRIFSPLTGAGTLEENQLGKIRPESVSFTENLTEPGSFSFSISGREPYTEVIRQGRLIWFRADGLSLWGILRGADERREAASAPFSYSGDDLKGYLKQRICLYGSGSDLEGYDTAQGSTETVLKHYVQNNAVSPADPKRKIPGLSVAPDQQRGIPDDRYMARFQRLSDLLQDVSAAQEMGWKVEMDLAAGGMVMDVIAGADRTAGQSERPRIILDADLHTAASSRFVSDSENYRNAFYTTKSGAAIEAEATTLLFFRENDAEPEGGERFETQIEVDVDDDAEDIAGEMENLARKEATNFERDDAFTVELNGAYAYGKDFFLGDFVTIRDRVLGRQEDVQLVSATHSWTGLGYRLTGTFGKPRKSNLQILERQIRTGGK